MLHWLLRCVASRCVITSLCERLCVSVDKRPSERPCRIRLNFYSSFLNVIVLRVRPIRIPPTPVYLNDVIEMEANAEASIQLIEVVRDYLCVWLVFPKSYRDARVRESAWKEIANQASKNRATLPYTWEECVL